MAAVELKGGQNLNVERMVDQLKGGTRLIGKVVDGQPINDYYPILLYSGERNLTSALTDVRISIQGLTRRIVVKPCGTELTAMVN